MGKPLSMDLRSRALAAVDEGMSCRAAARCSCWGATVGPSGSGSGCSCSGSSASRPGSTGCSAPPEPDAPGRGRVGTLPCVRVGVVLLTRDLRVHDHPALATALRDHDALILPTVPIVAPKLGVESVRVGSSTDTVRNATLKCTQLFNITGHPAITIPCGANGTGLPVGLQIVGARGNTRALLQVARAVEQTLAAVGA